VNGRPAAVSAPTEAPLEWSDTSYDDGLSLLGQGGLPTADLTLSDLRISRLARTPGRRVSMAPPVVSISATKPTQNLTVQLGVLKTVGAGVRNLFLRSSVPVIRIDKLLTITPIKAGPPDAAYPSLGASGKYSYNWSLVDRLVRAIVQAHARPYISIDASPSILGGEIPPYPANFASPETGPFPPQPPNDDAAYATMVGDLVNRVVKQDHVTPFGWGLWNEPDSTAFWLGSEADYNRLYAAVAPAVKAADPAALVGGPEITSPAAPIWLPMFIDAAAAAHVPLDFISFHYYDGSLGTIDSIRALVDRELTKVGLPSVPLVVGEWNFHLTDSPAAKVEPYRSTNVFADDWGAAFDASSLITMQRDGVDAAVMDSTIISDPNDWTLATPSEIRAPGNVYRMWSMLGSHVLATSGAPPPGTSVIATRKPNGDIVIMLAYMRYRRDRNEPIMLRLPGIPSGAAVTEYEIDRHHSDSFDAGPAHASLQQVRAPAVTAGEIAMSLPPDSVTLLQLHNR
jgi:hypothetical protein